MISNRCQHVIFSETRFLTSLCPFYTVHIVCSDKPELPICSQLPTYGNFCTEYFNWSVKHCPKSCGFCGGTVVETFSFLVYLFIFYYFLIYSLFAPMDKCHHTTFKKKTKFVKSCFKNVTVFITGTSWNVSPRKRFLNQWKALLVFPSIEMTQK